MGARVLGGGASTPTHSASRATGPRSRTHRTRSSPRTPEFDDGGTSLLLISLDPPEHTKLRKLISSGFTPRRINDLAGHVKARVDSVIDAVADRGECDLVKDIALWLPLHAIADLVGVPEADRRQVFEWTELTFGFDPDVPPERRMDAAMAMYAYADAMCAERRAHPRDDLMSVLLEADIDGDKLTDMQLSAFFMLLQNAGSETTRNLITTGTLALLERPDQLDKLRSDLSLLPTAIEELLRYSTPVMSFTRTATRDTEVGGSSDPGGRPRADRVRLREPRRPGIRSTRRDRRHPRPERPRRVRRRRARTSVSARTSPGSESKLMFEAILTRFDGLEVTADPAELPRVHSNLIDGFAEMPVRWSGVR